ncbi:LysR family transcriptional regulator [Variovorax paradoxus]|uniref:LysR family transcriptional regulator n=1 Tax=Variovorax paradoxus TaxID=34073 RepID=A0A5Q0M5M4_VARPD|nr:LysR substrate-binding domain-containing protein [Variovorax paradoxus]QFZ84746.1 LysR family transcriptional regulator [Variovorax paradoxus]
MIELRHLRYFVAAAEELNFRRAAERVHIDQTPLSRTVRDLEDKLGVRLFIRAPRRLQLTPAGAKLLEHARRLLLNLERTKRVVRATDARCREPLRLGVDESTAQPKLADCLSRWCAVAPEIPVDLTELRAAELLGALRAEEVDAVLSFGLVEDEDIAQVPAWTSPIVAIVPLAHELARREAVSLDELYAFPVIYVDATCHPGLCRQMGAILQERSLSPTIVGRAYTLAGCLTRVAAGLGVAVADADQMQAVRRPNVVVLPLTEKLHFTTYVLHKRRSSVSAEVLKRFLAHVTTSY